MTYPRSTLEEPFLSRPEGCCNDQPRRMLKSRLEECDASMAHDEILSADPSLSHPMNVIDIGNRNIRTTFAVTLLTFATRSILGQSVLPIFVIIAWKDRPEYIGYTLAITSLTQTFSSVGTRNFLRLNTLENKDQTENVILMAALICLSAIGTYLCVIFNHPRSFSSFLLANGLWGVSWGFMDSALQALFSQSASLSVETMTKKYNICYNMVRLGNITGTLLALVIFLRTRDEWTIQSCEFVMTAGLACSFPVVCLLCSLKTIPPGDDYEDHEQILEPQHEIFGSTMEEAIWCNETNDRLFEEIDDDRSITNTDETGQNVYEQHESDTEDASASVWRLVVSNDRFRVPLMIYTADILSSIAGGMSIWYFPAWLVQVSDIQPVLVQVLYLIIPIGQWTSPVVVTMLANTIGPCRACITIQLCYVLLMSSMITFQRRGFSIWIVLILYFLHASTINSTSSLSKGMLKRYVHLDERHNWNIAEHLQMLFWSLAAGTGGAFVGRWGFHSNFVVTAMLQVLASIPLAILHYVSNPTINEESVYSDIVEAASQEDSLDHDGRPSSQTKPSPLCFGFYFDHIGNLGCLNSGALSPSTQTTEFDSDSISSFP